MDTGALAALIDHTCLRPEATQADIIQLCAEAKTYGFAAVCVNPIWVSLAARELASQAKTTVCTVIGFPLGATTTEVKVYEARQALESGAREIDMVLAIGKLREGDWPFVEADIRAVVDVVHAHQAICKVIIETALLSEDEKIKACRIIQSAGGDFVKTSTGFSSRGATVQDIELLRQTVGDKLGVKASGGIRDRATAERLIAAGATRLGTSNGVAIIEDRRAISRY
ncbi:MAG: deoxyribose-phosphate aldolase [Chloracidobacterium sp.]|nr:deoxyribose-phosphate aldolase [Chloracidobacterium sp.]MDW8217327.1 deoxyribose-phosphate aldolase [Acidobacteriota bacterium]